MELIKRIQEKSENDAIPLVRPKTLSYLQKLIDDEHVEAVLEIGTAYGYSAYAMSLCKNVHRIITIEKDLERFVTAQEFLKDIEKISLVNCDAFTFESSDKFDLIFIDGPKSHQDVLVNKYLNQLKPKGLIVIDNIFLKKFNGKSNLTKNQQSLVEKVNTFRNWLMSNEQFSVEILDVEDGIAIIKKKQ